MDNRYRVARDKLNFTTDGYKADGVDYCIVTRIILITVHVELTAVIYTLIFFNANDRIISSCKIQCFYIMFIMYRREWRISLFQQSINDFSLIGLFRIDC